MARDPRYDILFEPVKIGPVTAKNRFYQVPHCNGMGYRDVSATAEMRHIKAQGGWSVVCTEMVEIHHGADVAPYIELRNWSDDDIPALARIATRIHDGGALAGIELCHSGHTAPNRWSREVPIAVSAMPVTGDFFDPVTARAMDKEDIRNLRLAHRAAALRARRAGFDLVYVYAGHGLGIFQHFLSRATNQRNDEYGGALANRARLLREVIEDTKQAVGATCAVPVRIAMNEFKGAAGLEPAEVEDAIAGMAELPDLWDLSLSSWGMDSQTSRFSEEGFQEPHIAGVRKLTSKPVVGVGRYTSPDAMVRVIKSGIMDMIGAARPSIADPFLPRKIEEGRLDDIRECIGCNICVTGDMLMTPIRCTQNPSMGEEWRKGWHPENIRPRSNNAHVLVVGAGPAGLEAARALGSRGHKVTLADAAREAGGRVACECRLPGLAAWGRVRDWRMGQIGKLTNVELYLESDMTAEQVAEVSADHVLVATGANWRRDGVGRHHRRPVAVAPGADLLTPDDLMQGKRPRGRDVIVFDDDHYYMGGVLAELLAKQDYRVKLVTPASVVSVFTRESLEQERIQARLIGLGVEIIANRAVTAVNPDNVDLACVFTGKPSALCGDTVVLVTSRQAQDALYTELGRKGLAVSRAGDCLAPATIAAAVYAGRRFAEEFGDPPRPHTELPFRRELTAIAPLPHS
jgi:dimethylamine/trimethylamine dehydrogenase